MAEPNKNENEPAHVQNKDTPLNGTSKSPAAIPNGSKTGTLAPETNDEEKEDAVFQVSVKLPHQPYEIKVMVSTQEQVQDLRQSIVELPSTFQYSCFHLEHNGERINDFVELSEVKGLMSGSEIRLIEDPYSEKEARMHLIRVRDLIGAAGDKIDALHGISAGLSLHEHILPSKKAEGPSQPGKASRSSSHSMTDFDFEAPASITALLPPSSTPPPKTVKSISVSVWNPPPHQLRQKGHLMYLQVTTNEGEQHQITAHVSGFFVNKSSNSKFDPFPRPAPKNAFAHSLLTLTSKLSPSFDSSFRELQEHNSLKDPLANFQFTNALPFNPWLVPPPDCSLSAHRPDVTRTQETYLLAGVENAETLRDWNEEFQSTHELPKETVQDRVFRERLTSKLFADYNEAAVRGAVMVATGEVAPLNPTEVKDAQIFVYNNIFFSFGADGVGTFTTEGGDEAARVAVGKDVVGVRMVNQLDIPGLFTSGTVILDYLGKRIVAQSIVPGIFKQREPGENQIDYGGVEGRDIVAEDEKFVSTFAKMSRDLKVKKHDVWDKEGKKHTLEASVETKGLLGTDARRYVLDLYRLTPLDVLWLEEFWSDMPGEGEDTKARERDYPHRMAVLRPELIDAWYRLKLMEYSKQQAKDHPKTNGHLQAAKDTKEITEADEVSPNASKKGTESFATTEDNEESGNLHEAPDASNFELALNPDVYCHQVPQTEEEKKQMLDDEAEVRYVCRYLREQVITELINDLKDGEVGFPMDGQSLSKLLQKRGINLRYLGVVATLAQKPDSRLEALHTLAIHEMVARSFKHEANRMLKDLPAVFAGTCISHLLNCFLGADFNKTPAAQLDQDMQSLYPDAKWTFADVTPESLTSALIIQAHRRFRFDINIDWFLGMNRLAILREVALKMGIQLSAKDYQFKPVQKVNGQAAETQSDGALAAPIPITNGYHVNGTSGKKKKRNNLDPETRSNTPDSISAVSPTTFEVDDIVNIMPVVKDACPKSTLAEEALEAGRISILQNQKELGLDLLLESLSLHEQIYGILHPEVARVYHQLSTLYYQMDEKNAAVELAHKAVIVSERTLGVDSNETILSYLNLGLFEHASGNTNVALAYVRHALELWKIIYGPDHPDSITTLNNAAVMLQHMKHYHDSRIWFERSLAICEKASGKSSVNTATLSFQLAQALALDQDAKGAVQRMREAYSIFHSKLGPEDRNTKESETWLEQLTHNAVSIAKHAKDVQARRLRKIQLTPKVTLGTRPQPSVGQSSADAGLGKDTRNAIGMDSRSVDELMKFIEGGGNSMTENRSSKKRTTRGNPKRRGGRSVNGMTVNGTAE